MAFNPYASEDFNRIQTKSTKSAEEQKAEREAAKQQVDHPLMEGKKLDMTAGELKTFTQAMGREEFRTGLDAYLDEISDPKHKPEMQQYLRQLEEQGDLPPGTILIQPAKGFCLKTTAKRLTSEQTKSFFDQKCFINVCFHDKVEKPQREHVTAPSGETGYNWKLPYRVSKLRYDQDNKKQVCSTYDVVFHTDVVQFLHHPEYKKFVADTALDGIGQVLAEHKEKVSRDYKIMKNLDCKGGEPSLMTVKEKTGNPLVDNMDIDNVQTRLEKEIVRQKELHMTEEEKAAAVKRKAEEAAKAARNGEVSDEEEEEPEAPEERPTMVVQPKHKIVHSYPVDLGDAWGGFCTSEMEHEKQMKQFIPTHLTVTIDLRWAESMKAAKLDINETTLVFEYPDLYYLDLNLKYKCDPDSGSAKFDKSKKTLTIQLPVVGLTADSQAVVEANYQKHVVEHQETLKALQVQGDKKLEEEETKPSEAEAEDETDEQRELREQAMRKLTELSSQSGVGSSKTLLLDGEAGINDPYNLAQDTAAIKKKMQEDSDDDGEGKNTFLNVYDENKNSQLQEREQDTKLSEVRVTQEENQVQDGEGKPTIQEMSSTTFDGQSTTSGQEAPVKREPLAPKFSWESAERVEAQHQFIDQGGLVFLNFNFKGYNKEKDARFALSDNEILLEVRDVAKNKVHRVCKTLSQPIDCKESSVQLLVDYIVFKIKKQENKRWDNLGYDIQEFHVPESHHYMRSNFLKQESAKVGDVQDDKENNSKESNKENVQKSSNQEGKEAKKEEPEKELTEEEKFERARQQEQEVIEKMVNRARTVKQLSSLKLKSDFFAIY